jgi:uncharacterized protein with NAD-binding domain and iron-sulfur cluster
MASRSVACTTSPPTSVPTTVLSLPGTTRYRMAADGFGYENLVLAGDWTRTDWNVGCIEAAVSSGINAAAAIEGRETES